MIRSDFITECSFRFVFLFVIIIILDCSFSFYFVHSVGLDIIILVFFFFTLILEIVILVITSDIDDGLLVVFLLQTVIWRVRGLLTHKLGVGPGTGDTVGAEDGVEVPDDFGLKMDGALNSALVDALDGLLDSADSADIMAKERHSGYLDIAERDPHLVDEVEIHKVSLSDRYLGRDIAKGIFLHLGTS